MLTHRLRRWPNIKTLLCLLGVRCPAGSQYVVNVCPWSNNYHQDSSPTRLCFHANVLRTIAFRKTCLSGNWLHFLSADVVLFTWKSGYILLGMKRCLNHRRNVAGMIMGVLVIWNWSSEIGKKASKKFWKYELFYRGLSQHRVYTSTLE